mmetsp:Transcript_83038/g.230622  ORF Transcript_83038/g.230622 Transcript_83038/m.230622 type:complete len:167 (-) Transcript_83038:58-558(-)
MGRRGPKTQRTASFLGSVAAEGPRAPGPAVATEWALASPAPAPEAAALRERAVEQNLRSALERQENELDLACQEMTLVNQGQAAQNVLLIEQLMKNTSFFSADQQVMLRQLLQEHRHIVDMLNKPIETAADMEAIDAAATAAITAAQALTTRARQQGEARLGRRTQ